MSSLPRLCPGRRDEVNTVGRRSPGALGEHPCSISDQRLPTLFGPGFWALVFGGGAVFVSLVHFGPTAVEPPAMMLHGYDSPILGWLAFTLLVTFVTVLAVTSLYQTRISW
jgi:hypothetical protein